MIASLSEPEVMLTGRCLPGRGQPLEGGAPATALPDDTPVGVVEALLRAYTAPGAAVCFLFGRSLTPIVTSRRLGRVPVLVDPYADCLDEGERSVWEPAGVLDIVLAECPMLERFQILLVHLPAPGVVDREALLYPGVEPPARPVRWESLSRERFFRCFENRIRQWEPTVASDGRIAILSTPSNFSENPRSQHGGETHLFPFAQARMLSLGWSLVRRHPVRRQKADSPVRHPALESATLCVYQREGEQ